MKEISLHKSLWPTHGLMLLATCLVSTSFTVGKAITDGMDPAVITLIRFTVAAILFLPYVKLHHSLKLPTGRSLLRYSIISAALVTFFWLMFLSLRYTSAVNTGVLFTLVPGISGLYSAILLKERLGLPRLLALLLAMTGALLVIFHGKPTNILNMELNRGDLIFFIGCLFMALYTPLVKLLHRGEHMAIMTFWVLVTGSGWLLLFSGPHLLTVPWASIDQSVWLGILYLAIFCTIITFFLSQTATLHLGPTRVMAYSYLYPPLIIIL
ncbi:MAG: DMT family transporter, partial [Desulfobulbaceae bacterium]|nr:DMT family transporter [Desulfobulbaceae bacterium]